MKKILKLLLIILAVIIIIPGAYLGYVFLSYHRLGNYEIGVQGMASESQARLNNQYKIVTYNIGFGAYEKDYDFFMDGGTRSWAFSRERLDTNLKNISMLLDQQNADFYFIQEVDTDSTRSYHINETYYMNMAPNLASKSYTYAQNYDSPFLFYPLLQPHGRSRSGIMVFSSVNIKKANRIELPIESGMTKFLDLDRCYSKNRVSVENGKDLVLYNFHLSAYTSDGRIAVEQLRLIIDDIEQEYAQGNYCIAGGDFNKDILGDSSIYFGKSDKEYTWGQPIPEEVFIGTHIEIIQPLDLNNPIPSCRNADSPYHQGQYVLTIDGFMVTDNVSVTSSNVIDTTFLYSDHNPVYMNFSLVG